MPLRRKWHSRLKGRQKNLKISDKTVKIDPLTPDHDLIVKAASVIRKGGIVLFPTRNLYGLAADAYDTDAVERIYKIKGRSAENPVLVLVDSYMMLSCIVRNIPLMAQKVMQTFWPGGITIIFEANDSLPANLTRGTGKIGIRRPGHPVALALVRAVSGPITGTSANISGSPGCFRVSDIDPDVTDQVDMIIDAGDLRGGNGSTVVDFTGELPVFIREGEVPKKKILEALNLTGHNK
jgi:L-threonylcarbamoyladenylate synthase